MRALQTHRNTHVQTGSMAAHFLPLLNWDRGADAARDEEDGLGLG